MHFNDNTAYIQNNTCSEIFLNFDQHFSFCNSLESLALEYLLNIWYMLRMIVHGYHMQLTVLFISTATDDNLPILCIIEVLLEEVDPFNSPTPALLWWWFIIVLDEHRTFRWDMQSYDGTRKRVLATEISNSKCSSLKTMYCYLFFLLCFSDLL